MYSDTTYQPFTYETDDAVYFFTSALDPLNNWSAHAVEIWGTKFPTPEHAYHWRKYSQTELSLAEQILQAPCPYTAMMVDRQTDRTLSLQSWDDCKVSVMEGLLRAKVVQNQDVRDCLLKTGSKQIIEISPFDDFWGCGPRGDGQNMMGKLLEKVRQEIS